MCCWYRIGSRTPLVGNPTLTMDPNSMSVSGNESMIATRSDCNTAGFTHGLLDLVKPHCHRVWSQCVKCGLDRQGCIDTFVVGCGYQCVHTEGGNVVTQQPHIKADKAGAPRMRRIGVDRTPVPAIEPRARPVGAGSAGGCARRSGGAATRVAAHRFLPSFGCL